MIVDAHCHAGTGDGFTGPWDTLAKLDDYLVRAERAGIDRSIVFPVFNSDYPASNRRLARIVADHRDRLWGFAALHPQREAAQLRRHVGRAVEELGLIGIKIHGAEAHPTRGLCVLARKYGLPILYDIFRQPARVEMLANAYPDVAFIVPHLGGFADDWMVFLSVIDQIVRLPNVYADTSGVRYFEALVMAAKRAPQKLIFGSDGPLLHPGVELQKVLELPLSPTHQRNAIGGTICRLLPLLGE